LDIIGKNTLDAINQSQRFISDLQPTFDVLKNIPKIDFPEIPKVGDRIALS
jgi:hypothetical protein